MRLLGKLTISGLLMMAFVVSTFAQFTLSGEFRPRTEYLHGYKNLAVKDMKAPFFTSQRTRLNLDHKSSSYNFYVSLQDVRFWGATSQLASADGAATTIHQAYAQIFLGNGFSLKAGRQEIALDDHRIMGSVGWAQQARSHDAFVFKYNKNATKADLGITFNINKNAANYHALQYLWLHHDFDKFGSSILFLNNGTKGEGDIQYSQTIGTRSGYKGGNFSAFVNAYFQTGKMASETDINAHLLGLDIGYKLSDKTKIGLGYERLSGNDFTDPNNENNAFTPFYGTNHKFNGHMDYFYVGNHVGSVGLQDISFKVNHKFGKVGVGATYHYFMTAADYHADLDNALGSEIDLSLGFPLATGAICKVGYSHLLPSETLADLRGGSDEETNNWAWLMIIVKPTLFTTKEKE